MKFKLICHPAESILSLKKDETIKEWGFEDRDVKSIVKLAAAGGSVLFGQPPVAVLTIDSSAHLKEIVAEFESLDKKDRKIKADNGLIILTDAAANSTKKLITLATKFGADVDNTAKKDVMTNDSALVQELGLSKPVENFLLDWAGQETSNLVSLIRNLSDIPESQRKKVSIDDIMIRLPLPPGSIPPWDLEKPLFAKDVDKAIIMYRRIAGNTGPLLALWNLNKKFQQMYKAAFLIKNQPGIKDDELAKITGASPNAVKWFLRKEATKIGVDRLEEIVKILAKLDSEFKSGVTKPDARFEIALVQIIQILKNY